MGVWCGALHVIHIFWGEATALIHQVEDLTLKPKNLTILGWPGSTQVAKAQFPYFVNSRLSSMVKLISLKNRMISNWLKSPLN